MDSPLARALVLVTVLGGLLAACVPTAARKNARLKDGVDIELVGGVQYAEAEAGSNNGADEFIHLEVDIQYAHKAGDGSGFAGQLKIPLFYPFTTLDLYYQLPETNSKWFFGFGAEVGILPGLYAVATHYVDDRFYVSLTPRVLNAESDDQRGVLINPQLSFGFDDKVDLSAFVNFAHHTGRGFDFDVFSDDTDSEYRKNFWLIGGSVRF